MIWYNYCYIKKNIIKLPILGKIRITENDYLPDIESISSGRIIKEYDKYYVMFIIREDKCELDTSSLELGIDVGITTSATVSSNYLEPKFIKYFKSCRLILSSYLSCLICSFASLSASSLPLIFIWEINYLNIVIMFLNIYNKIFFTCLCIN